MNFSFLTDTLLFQGIKEKEIKEMLGCLDAAKASFEKGDFIYHSGQTVEQVGMVLSGSVMIESDDLWGNRSVLGHIEPGHIFAEAYACLCGEPLLVNVTASGPTEILFLNTSKLLKTCSNSCSHHNMLIKNLMQILAHKNLQLSHRILYTSSKSIRGRLMSFLSDQVKQAGSRTVVIPFNRQQLADYLGLDRSAMCKELSKMQKEGILTYHKNRFQMNVGLS